MLFAGNWKNGEPAEEELQAREREVAAAVAVVPAPAVPAAVVPAPAAPLVPVPEDGVVGEESPPGTKFIGEWRDGKRHGEGILMYADGSRYEGSWVDDKEEGFGRYYLADGTRYEGQWKAGDMHGEGTLYGTDGKVRDQPASQLPCCPHLAVDHSPSSPIPYPMPRVLG